LRVCSPPGVRIPSPSPYFENLV